MLLSMKPAANPYFRVHQLFAHHYRGRENTLPTFHFHNEMEINFLSRGEVVYNYGGHAAPLPLRTLTLFWGGVSHRFETWKPGSEIWVVNIPLGLLLSWGLPNALVHRLLRGDFIHAPDPASARADAEAMRRWHADLRETPGENSRPQLAALLLELQARVLRLALDSKSVPATAHDAPNCNINRMLRVIAAHFREPGLDVARIARHAGLTPNHANASFHKACGTSLMRYVNRQRVHHAQSLLAAGGAKVLDVALDAGFGSASQFYHVFREVTGASPREHMRMRGINVAHSDGDVLKFTYALK